MMRYRSFFAALAALAVFLPAQSSRAQGVTTSAMSVTVTDSHGAPRSGVRITAIHEPSGTLYQARTREDGRATMAGMRIGGPYKVTAASIGFQSQSTPNVFLTLGQRSDIDFSLKESAVELGAVTVTAGADKIINSSRMGAATTVSREALATLPSVSGKLESIVRLTPQFGGCSTGGGCSLAGQDGRLNNISIDGSSINSFGLGGQPGDRTNVVAISLSAIDQMQINIAPFDVRQGNFVGANINTVTRSGTNALKGSVGYNLRNRSLVGRKAGPSNFDPGEFKFHNLGGWLSGPIVQNKLFFFASLEDEALSAPGTTWRANSGSETVTGNVTRVKASDLDALSSYLSSKFGYDTGPYSGYNNEVPARRFLGKLDFNLNSSNKFVVRYNQLDSRADILESNSNSLGNLGNRRTNANSLNFQNSNYGMLENIKSIIGEWNSVLMGGGLANNMSIGYTKQDESREPRGQVFPLVDIQEGTQTYTSFGFEPFTPNNVLLYNTLQFQDNITKFTANHDFTFGVSLEKYNSTNIFFSGSQSVYVYNSLADFYTDANGYLANKDRTVAPITLNRFQVRYANLPGQDIPIQPMQVYYNGIYGQDEWRAAKNLKVNLGIRFDAPFFKKTAIANPNADKLTWRDENGDPVKYDTGKLPDAKIAISPRLGINWDVTGNRNTQIRGGTGIFSGRPAYVWISNQIGTTGMLTGFDDFSNTTARPFNPDPNHYKPGAGTGAPAASYELALTDPNFKFPKLWRSDIAIDKRLPWGMIGTAEYLYNKDVDGVYYINANLPAAPGHFVGVDGRKRWTGTSCSSNILVGNPTGCVNRINNAPGNLVARNIVLKNQNVGRAWNIDGSLERPFSNGLFIKAAYNYGVAKNTIDPGSVASGSWNGNAQSDDPNNPGLSYSANSPGKRFFVAASWRKEYFSLGATTLSVFFDAHNNGNFSFTYAGDLNGDGSTTNDLIYIPRNISEMNFRQFNCASNTGCVTTPRTITAAEQATAFEAFINQDDYLSKHRGQYAVRNAVFAPFVKRADMSISQEVFTDLVGRRNSLQIRADIVNVGNLINRNWGLGQRVVGGTTQILTSPGADSFGKATYQLRVVNDKLLEKTYETSAGRSDVFEVQLGLRYTFN